MEVIATSTTSSGAAVFEDSSTEAWLIRPVSDCRNGRLVASPDCCAQNERASFASSSSASSNPCCHSATSGYCRMSSVNSRPASSPNNCRAITSMELESANVPGAVSTKTLLSFALVASSARNLCSQSSCSATRSACSEFCVTEVVLHVKSGEFDTDWKGSWKPSLLMKRVRSVSCLSAMTPIACCSRSPDTCLSISSAICEHSFPFARWMRNAASCRGERR